jgi:hypothetical protein
MHATRTSALEALGLRSLSHRSPPKVLIQVRWMGLADDIRERVERGYLPATQPTAVWWGFGAGEFCRGCSDSIALEQIRDAVELADRDTLSFSRGVLRVVGLGGPPSRGSRPVVHR